MGIKVGCQTYGWFAYAAHSGSKFCLKMVLDEVAKAGFKGVDLSGFSLEELGKPADCRKLFDSFGLKLVSMSCSVGDAKREDLKVSKKGFQFMSKMGARAAMVGGGVMEKGETYEKCFNRLVEQCDELSDFGRKLGIKAGIHNHLGTVVETEGQIRRFLSQSRIGWCPDTGHLAVANGRVTAMLKDYAKRIVHGHLKDALVDGNGELVRFTGLGQGNLKLDIPEVIQVLNSIGFSGWFTVEQDHATINPCCDAIANANYLRQIGCL